MMYSVHVQHPDGTFDRQSEGPDICCNDAAYRTACRATEKDGIQRQVWHERGGVLFDTSRDDWPEELLTSRTPKKENVK